MATPSIRIPPELRQRILYTLGILAVYRVGVHVPVPGVDASAMLKFFESQSGGIFGLFNTFTGGALERFSIFALGIMPYISASIIFQLLQTAIPYLDQLRKEGGPGQKKLNQYTRYATIVLALIQGGAMATFLRNSSAGSGESIVVTPEFGASFLSFHLVTVVTLMAGTCFVMWLGEQITEYGIGNGSSLIIFSGIAAGIPGGAIRLYNAVTSADTAAGHINGLVALAIVAGMVAVIGAIVFLEVGQRRIPIQYSQRAPSRDGMGQSQTQASHLPLKINFANVIPPIFASSLLMFPATIGQFTKYEWLRTLADTLRPDHSIYNVLFVGLIVFFSYFYTEIVFNPTEVSDNLKKYGGFIPGIRAGKTTADYIAKVIDRLTIFGAIYLSVICVMPGILQSVARVPFIFGGTSVLILVGVALDTSQQIQSHLLTARYEGMLKGVKMKSRRVQY